MSTYENISFFLVRESSSLLFPLQMLIVLDKTFQKLDVHQQKLCFLLVDEVKIRPTVAYSGGVLSGMSKNDPDSKASAMLGVLLKCLHGGPSVMISITPVHNSNARYQFEIVKKNAALVERSGGIVLGSITDNHKVNQNYCTLFERNNKKETFEADHPLDPSRSWFLLYDPVHMLKCIRNNWLSEKCLKLTFDGEIVGSFEDVRALYASERENILKMTPLTQSSVYPGKLQLQNVQHVLSVFNDKVVAALRLNDKHSTANFIQQVLTWWNIVNVSSKGQDTRMREPSRSVQDVNSTSLQPYIDLFSKAKSGHGTKRINMLTHDTKKALVQTTAGQIAVCKFLFTQGFKYVPLRDLQSDRIEGEFSVYRQSTGGSSFMVAGDVLSAFKQRLTRFAASTLQSLEGTTTIPSSESHECMGIQYEDAAAIEACVRNVSLMDTEELSCAYVAGWLEMKCTDLNISEDEPLVSDRPLDFITEVSRGKLTIPHIIMVEFVKSGLRFMNFAKQQACCRKKLASILKTMSDYHDYGFSSKSLLRRLSNVLLHGLHKLEKDHQANSTLYQTSIKKARMAE